MKSNSKGKINSNQFSLVQPLQSAKPKNLNSSSAVNSNLNSNAKLTATSMKNTFRKNTTNIKTKTTKNSRNFYK